MFIQTHPVIRTRRRQTASNLQDRGIFRKPNRFRFPTFRLAAGGTWVMARREPERKRRLDKPDFLK